MADDNSTPDTSDQTSSEDAPVTEEATPKPPADVPPEIKAALRKANKEAETLRLRLKEFEDRDKTEAERQAERMKALEAEAVSARTEALRLRVAAKFGIGDEDADLFLTGSDEESLTRQAKRLADREAEQKKKGNYVPREGHAPGTSTDDDALARQILLGG